MLNVRLREVFVDALGLAPDVEVENLAYRKHENWDSISHLALVEAIEDAFGVLLTTEQVVDLDSFATASQMLAELGVRSGNLP